MLHRIFAMLIVGFWLAMTGLLVVRELFPEATRLNTVPAKYVGELLFQHLQSSDLQIYDGAKELGYLHLQPRKFEPNTRVLEFHGVILLSPLGTPKQRLSWSGAITLSANGEVKAIQASLSTQEPPNQLDVFIDSAANTAKFTVRAHNHVVDQSAISMDMNGVTKLLERAGLDPAIAQQLQTSATSNTPGVEPEITAQQSSTRLNGETISTYLVTMKVSGQTLFDAHITQLGQVLRAQMPLFGYKLMPYNVRP